MSILIFIDICIQSNQIKDWTSVYVRSSTKPIVGEENPAESAIAAPPIRGSANSIDAYLDQQGNWIRWSISWSFSLTSLFQAKSYNSSLLSCASYIFLIFFIFFMFFVDFAHFYGNLDSFSVLEYRLIDPLLFHEIENKISQFFRIILNWSRFPVFKKIILGNISVSSITFLPKGHCQSIF